MTLTPRGRRTSWRTLSLLVGLLILTRIALGAPLTKLQWQPNASGIPVRRLELLSTSKLEQPGNSAGASELSWRPGVEQIKSQQQWRWRKKEALPLLKKHVTTLDLSPQTVTTVTAQSVQLASASGQLSSARSQRAQGESFRVLECASLLQFKADASNGSSPSSFNSWNRSTQPNCCLWQGVGCDASGHVVSLSLPSSNLTGTISASLGNLTRLATLDLTHNQLRGTFPQALGAIPSLHSIIIQRNLLEKLPKSLWRPSLKYLDASLNLLFGPLPFAITNATQIIRLDLSQNWYFGRLPPDISLLTRLQILDISYNRMSEAIPPSLGSLPSLRALDLSGNLFSGTLPDSFSKLKALVSLSVSGNSFNGSLPSALAELKSLQYLDLSWNEFQGELPYQLTHLSLLQHLSLQGNDFSGAVPPVLTALPSLRSLDLAYNELSGTIPESLTSLSSLSYLTLSNNHFSGSIPSTLIALSQSLAALDLSYNKLEGTVPLFLTNLRSLSFLDLGVNNLTGGLPSFLSTLPRLRSVLVPNNPSLGGMLPQWSASSFSQLGALNVSNCNMTGPIPTSLFTISALTRFDFTANYFSGIVPENGLNRTKGFAGVFRLNCLLYSNDIPQDCPYKSRNGLCYLTGQRPLGECVPPVPASPSGVNDGLGIGILIFFVLICLFTLVLPALFFLHKRGSITLPFLSRQGRRGGNRMDLTSSPDAWDTMYLEGSDGALLIADTELPGIPSGIRRYTMDEVWTATANFSAYLDPEDLRPAFHGRLNRVQNVTVRLLPLPEEQIEESKQEFVERIVGMSRLNNPNFLSFRGYAYEDGCFVAVFEPAQHTLFERLHSANRSVTARPLTWRERMRIMVAIADALDFLHSCRFSGATEEEEDEEEEGGEGEEESEERKEEGEERGNSESEQEERAQGRSAGRRRRGKKSGQRRRRAGGGGQRDELVQQGWDEFFRAGPFIHGDVKSSNVLLTATNRGKLFDSLVPRNPEEDPLRSVSPHGSFGYLDPNYADSKTLTPASDVYSFGVLLLEIISGRPAMVEDSATLIVMAQDYFVDRDDYPKLLDPTLSMRGPGEENPEGVDAQQLIAMVEMVQACTQVKERHRPTMLSVKQQMMSALDMQPQEFMPAQQEIQMASEIEIEMMSEGTPARFQERQRSPKRNRSRKHPKDEIPRRSKGGKAGESGSHVVAKTLPSDQDFQEIFP